VRRLLRLFSCAVLAAVAVASVSGTVSRTSVAYADPGDLAGAQAQAAELVTAVAGLETQAEIATEQYDGVAAHLGEVVSRYLTTKQQLDGYRSESRAERSRASARVRALYMSGGSAGLLASVLDGGDIGDILARVESVNRVVQGDRRTAARTEALAIDLQRTSADLEKLTAERLVVEQQAQAAADRVRTLVAQRQAELDAANATVLRLMDEERRRRESATLLPAASPSLDFPALPEGLPAGVERALEAMRSRLGSVYVWGATGPDTFDCSGLTSWAYRQGGVSLPRTAAEQWNVGAHVSPSQLRPGDLLFWATDTNNPTTIHHVATYVGGGLMIHAPRTGDVVVGLRLMIDGSVSVDP
jgi:cell wall-associated NlpC family hydrolase